MSDRTGCEEVRGMSTREIEEVRGSMFDVSDQRAGCGDVRGCGLEVCWPSLEERRVAID